jgi:hypothetical protein
MREYILTETKKEVLKRYLKDRVKTTHVRVLLTRIRKNLPRIKEDLKLISRVVEES